MTKQSTLLNGPIITIIAKPEAPDLKVLFTIPNDKKGYFFSTLEQAINALRALDYLQAYVNDKGKWYGLTWSLILSPWEGPKT